MTSDATIVPIPLISTVKSKPETTTWSFYDANNRIRKRTVPTFDGHSNELLFHCIVEWDNALESFTGLTTIERFQFYRLAMTNMARSNWDTARRDLPLGADQHAAGFTQCVQSWKNMFISTDAVHRQIDYLRSIRRPKTMTVQAFRFRIETLIAYLRLFPRVPGDTANIDQEEKKEIILKAMPTVWQERFKRNNKLYNTNITDLVDFFEQERAFADETERRNNAKNKRKREARTHDSSPKKTQRPRHNKNGQLSNDSACPIHGGSHIWGQCFLNPYGDNYRPMHQQQATQNQNNRRQFNQSTNATNTTSFSHRSQSKRNTRKSNHHSSNQKHTFNYTSYESYLADNGTGHFDGAVHGDKGITTMAHRRRPSSYDTQRRPSSEQQ